MRARRPGPAAVGTPDPVPTRFKDSVITLSPSYKASDNLLLVAEFRRDDFGAGRKANSIALEALFSF